MLRLANLQVVPDHLLGHHTKLTGIHLGVGLVLAALHHLPCILGAPLGVELNEHSADKLTLTVEVFVLLSSNLGYKLVNMLATVLDGVDLLADEELELMGRAILGVEPLGPILGVRILEVLLALFSFHPLLVGVGNQLDLSRLKFKRGLVTVFNELLELLGVGSNPSVLDAGEHLEQGTLGQSLWHIGEQDGARRQATGAPG